MIEVRNLTKRFGGMTAVDNLSFSVEKGEVLGFLGPNGAGKSTTMRMVTGYFPPTSGSISIGGADLATNPIAAKAKIGYLPENAPLYPDMTVATFLAFAAELRGVSGSKKSEAIERVLDMCFLDPVRNQSIDTLSKGYRHRTCFAQSVIHDPEVLILDEPTDGLDPNQKHEVRGLIRRMGENKAIIFSTHILEEVDSACSRAIIIDQGKVVADGTPAELRGKSTRAGVVSVKLSGLSGSGILAELKGLAAAGNVEEETSTETEFVGRVLPSNRGDLPKQIFEMARAKNLVVHDLHEDTGKLDEMFREITGSGKN